MCAVGCTERYFWHKGCTDRNREGCTEWCIDGHGQVHTDTLRDVEGSMEEWGLPRITTY